MAEFVEVARAAKRMCKAYPACIGCPAGGEFEDGCAIHLGISNENEYAKFENIVMQWAKEHSEPQYPTWDEWQTNTFPGVINQLKPCHFVPPKERKTIAGINCLNISCVECRYKPIPADIAKKLGIKPKED